MLTYDLKKSPGVPLYEALYRCIRSDILEGKLTPGQKLPSKRTLAANLEVSKITVEAAYNQLLSEGSQDTEKMRSKITYLSSRATLMYMISISDCYSIGIHGFALQEASYQSMSIPIQNSGFMLEFGYVTAENAPISEIALEFIRDLKKRLS